MKTNSVFEIITGAVCCAIAFPVIGFKDVRKGSWLPLPLTAAQQAAIDNEKGTWFHRKKNLWVDRVRADAEWWGKFMSHVAWVEAILLTLCLIALAY